MIHLEPTHYTVRLYDEEDGYERRLPYKAVARLHVLGDKAIITAMHGSFTKKDRIELFAVLRSIGIRWLIAERGYVPSSDKITEGPMAGLRYWDLSKEK